ncbi:hypothetical protein B0H16DRAFT_1466571 [Mycena metata]|uniref:Uncharacterized protein n=1 Tax=Mycena metata TaxID=1033252 RepID=A0AAD7I8Z1_9AGAR|nr:hypothetical protein B0H16DRAFT_1466571 [Mycena metata]
MANPTLTAVVGESSPEPVLRHPETHLSFDGINRPDCDIHQSTRTGRIKPTLPVVHRLGQVTGALPVPRVDKLFKEVYNVFDAVEPLAYMMGTSEDIYVFFTAAGRYYFYNDGELYLSEEEFHSPEHFLEETLPQWERCPGYGWQQPREQI